MQKKKNYPGLSHSLDSLDFLVVNYVVVDYDARIVIGLLLLEGRDFQKGHSSIDVTTLEALFDRLRNAEFATTEHLVPFTLRHLVETFDALFGNGKSLDEEKNFFFF